MKQPFKSIMRVLFLLSALLGAATAAETFACDHVCVDTIYQAIAAVPESAGYKDGDMAVYGYILYQAYTIAQGPGMAWVGTVIEGIGEGCAEEGFDTDTRKGLADCFAGAKQEHVDEYEKAFEGTDAEEKKGIDWVVGAIANQLAPGSVFAKAYAGISAAEFEQALGVYYLVGAAYEAMNAIETDGLFTDDQKAACYTALDTAVGYEAGDNLVELLVAKADTLEAAFTGDQCFGQADVAALLADDATFADEKVVAAGVGDSVKAAEANVAKFKDSQPTADEPDDEEAAAAALSAVVALLAMML